MWSLKTYLIVTGIGAFLALSMPSLVVLGTFLLVIPGLILGFMPTAFMYGFAFAVIRWILGSVFSGVTLNALAAVATLALFWVIPQPGLASARKVYAGAKQPDVTPDRTIALRGHVLVTRQFGQGCDALCAALLRTPDVSSVRIGNQRTGYKTYRIASFGSPGQPVKASGFGLLEERKYNAADPLDAQRALEADWNLMLAGGKVLLAAEDLPSPDFTIAIEDGFVDSADDKARPGRWSLRAGPPHRKALTITDASNRVLLRQSVVAVHAPTAPLWFGTAGGMENLYFRWEPRRIGDGTGATEIPVERLLLDKTDISRGVNMQAAQGAARAELERALADPARPAGDPAFALSAQWMDSFRTHSGPLAPEDRALLAIVLEDPRVTSADGLGAMMPHVTGDAADLRRSAARRYLAAQDRKAARYWIGGVARLPAGAFAAPLPEEQQILSDPGIALHATGLIRRQGDRGTAAAPDLLRLLEAFATYDPGKYGFSDLTSATGAVRSAFRRIGPAAAPARPEIERLLETPGMHRRYHELEKQDWDVLLVVLGKPVASLTKPERRSGTDASYRERVAKIAARPFDPMND